ncbi:MAG: EAL domain-containing protein [Hyphomonas sp.]|uniref:putative bifunctional diguanylate cyclase/phosphodiesterase n=1 Tax=Hyphomonas sp. TaxID=87 RepID=UPI003529BD43
MGERIKARTNGWTFGDLIKDVPVPEKHAGSLRAKQLEMVRKMTAVLVLTNLLNTAVVLFSFRNTAADTLLYIWGACSVSASVFAILHQLIFKFDRDRAEDRSQAALDRNARASSLNGLLWAVVPIIVMNTTDPHGQMVMGIILAGMMFAGAFLMSRLPDAAFSFIMPVGIGMVIAMQFQQIPQYQYVSVLTLVYLGVLMLAIRWSHKQFVEQHLNEAAVNEQSQLIGLLLRDFEESTSDWLWQTNARGELQDIPLVFEGAIESNGVMRMGEPLTHVFVEDEALKILETSLHRRQGFRDLVLQVKTAPGEPERWWSVTGKPIFEQEIFKGFRGVAADISQSKEIEDRIAYMAHYDGLTGLPNRMTMQEHLEKAARKPINPKLDRALIWLDLDNFKWVNDTLGHQAGDELLQMASARLSSMCGESDIVARLSGDEFAMIVERDANGALEDFLDSLTGLMSEPYDLWGSTVNCAASVGVRMFDAFTSDARVMLKHADLALYQAKSQGKANWCKFTAELDEKARARQQIEADLHRALENNELRVYFQPLVDAKSHEMVGCETLVRWEHPKRGLIFQGEFIEHAEDNGLITRMGDWVIRAALAEARRLPKHVKISINISPLQIHSASLMSTVVNSLASNGIDPGRVELEITEIVLMSDTEFTLQRLHQLRALGVRIALDDFGTGFSSLSYLRSFPFDKIKIDKSFVADLENRSDSRAITIATLTLARSLGMTCTAEGVETSYQADFLRDNGCDELQGFFISRAQPLDKLRHLVDIRDVADLENEPVERVSLRAIEGGASQRAAKAS